MKIDIENLKHFHEIGGLVPGEFGDAKETACLMSALTSQTDFEGCEAEGWPRWLAELGAYFFDNAPNEELWERTIAFASAVREADNAGVDWDEIFCKIRLDSILPIAMKSIGEGNEEWRVRCRKAVQWSIDNGGVANTKTAWAAWAAGTARS